MGNLDEYQDVKEQNILFERVTSQLHFSPSLNSFIFIHLCVCFYLFNNAFLNKSY